MKPTPKYSIQDLNRLDVFIAALSGIAALGVYVRTMAPDILYGDSAELQTLAYTLGHTHSTGYPVYLLLARLVGFLPLQTPAWRVTLFSALAAALTVAGVYLLSRQLTNSRIGSFLASAWLALSYTLWSQAIITEVYAPGAAFLAWILLLVLRWHQNPEKRGKALFAAALLAGLSLGMHATTAIAAAPAAGFVLLKLAVQRAERAEWQRTLLAGGGGAILGVFLWLGAFLYIDWHNPPSSFVNVALYPSRTVWGLTAADLDSPLERISLTLNSVQWGGTLFAGGSEAARESLVDYLTRISVQDFSVWFLLLGLYGWWVLFPRSKWPAGYLLASYGLVLFYVLNYRVGDQFVFFLSTYVPFTAAAGAGHGALIEGFSQWKWIARRGWGRAAALLVTALLAAVLVQSPIAGRVPALKTGVATFVTEEYQFPVKNIKEPRFLASMYLSRLPDDALVLVEWRELYAMFYLAHVEGKKPGIRFVEAMPYGSNGKVTASMIDTIQQALAEGRPVYASQRYPGLEDHFQLSYAANRYVQIKP